MISALSLLLAFYNHLQNSLGLEDRLPHLERTRYGIDIDLPISLTQPVGLLSTILDDGNTSRYPSVYREQDAPSRQHLAHSVIRAQISRCEDCKLLARRLADLYEKVFVIGTDERAPAR